jgi:hypothetical protein
MFGWSVTAALCIERLAERKSKKCLGSGLHKGIVNAATEQQE